MNLGWWKSWRRYRLNARPKNAETHEIVAHALTPFADWPAEIQKKVVDDTAIMVHEKHWEGCNGLQLTQEMKLIVAAQAAMMLIGIQDYYFDGVRTILLYPASFRRSTSDGLLVGDAPRIGEAWHRGPIVLSWEDLRLISPGRNVVVHELAHHLDGLDGDIGGSPILPTSAAQSEWERVTKAEHAKLVDVLNRGGTSYLDPYAATNRAEFFAVSSEVFWEDPLGLKQHHPELFACLINFYRVDPSEWRKSKSK